MPDDFLMNMVLTMIQIGIFLLALFSCTGFVVFIHGFCGFKNADSYHFHQAQPSLPTDAQLQSQKPFDILQITESTKH